MEAQARHDRRSRPPRISEALRDFQRDEPVERVSLGDLISAMGDRVYGALMLILGFPNVIPVAIPGWSAFFGLPLILFASQLAFGLPRPWLPRWLAARSLARSDFDKILAKSLPHLERAERMLRPRWLWLTDWPSERVIGAVVVVLAIVISLPIPFGNMLPGLAVSVLALGLIERDGVAIVIGLALSVVSLVIVSAVVIAMVQAVVFFLTRAFA